MESFSSIQNYNSEPVQLGFAEAPKKGDFELKNFPSKIGGLPVWLLPLSNNIDESFFTCFCGKDLSFLLQLYSPLEDKDNCFHRMLYVFFCPNCWKKKDTVKVLRMNLPEKSTYYNGEEIINIKKITEDELTKKINEKLKKFLLEEFFISSAPEKKEASKLYFNFYNNAEEKSITSNDNSLNNLKDDEDEEIIINNPKEDKEYNDMVKNYLKENPGVNIEKIEEVSDDEKENDKILDSTNQDIIMNLFINVTNYDKQQVIRFYRNNYYPLWFTQEKMLTTKKTKCTNCGGCVEFEFQIMPYLFLIQPKISENDVGTIVIYTCKKCCDSKIEGGFVEEYGFIQRTGENFTDLNDNQNMNIRNKQLQKNKEKVIMEENEFFSGVNEKEADEEGFVEVKKKKNKKHNKKNTDDDKDDKKE